MWEAVIPLAGAPTISSSGTTRASTARRGWCERVADENFDVIAIGTSQGGRFLPVDLAKAGNKVALVERGKLGGVCVNTGCTPTKTMVASARLAYQARRGAEYGVRIGPVSVDLAAVLERKRAMVAGARQNYASRLALDGLHLIDGEAHFTGPTTLDVALTDGRTRQISAPVIVIDTGTRPRPLAINGSGDVSVLDSTSIMELDELPEHLIILGGGYIGLEFGQMFRRFGSEVTIIQSAARLMMIEDQDVSDEVAAILRDDGIRVLTSSMPVSVIAADGDRVLLTVRTPQGEQQLVGSHLLSAIGRVPNTEALTPEAAGIRLDDRGFIEVNEYLEASVPGVYAMGDVKGGPAFTHLSYDDYRILHANLIRHEKASTRDRVVPYTVFIDPQLGRVGMTEREARAQGRAIRVAKLPMNAVVRAIETGETRGFMKAVVDADSGQILGCAVLGVEGGEIMTMIQVAMLGKLTYTAMADAVFTHPLMAEGLNTLFAALDA
jgi:pyruvate/2-oxoglutarate dehydrogenase complex dihydrolipoamide dehydrogenase (E3) component